MARDLEPMTDEEKAAFEAAMDEQREELLAALAEELGGDPEDYRWDSDDYEFDPDDYGVDPDDYGVED